MDDKYADFRTVQSVKEDKKRARHEFMKRFWTWILYHT